MVAVDTVTGRDLYLLAIGGRKDWIPNEPKTAKVHLSASVGKVFTLRHVNDRSYDSLKLVASALPAGSS